VDKRDQLGHFRCGKSERRHAFVRPSLAQHLGNLVSGNILRYQFGARQIWARFSAGCISTMTERAILLE